MKDESKSKVARRGMKALTWLAGLSYCHRQLSGPRSAGARARHKPFRRVIPTRQRIEGGFGMYRVSLQFFPARQTIFRLLWLGAISLVAIGAVSAQPQRARAQTEDKPLFADFRGVSIGMPAEEVRKKLGGPRDKADDLDIYLFNENQAVQVYYDKAKTVSAISIDFMTGATGIPSAKDVVGGDPDTRPDGSSYKMVRYPKAGYWVSYSKTAGDSPTITITMQKIEH
jgi:hypothetical protein